MELQTFTKEITFLSNTFDNKEQALTLTPVKKTFTFKELSRTDKSQHKLFFLMYPLFRTQTDAGGNQRTIADPETLHNLTNTVIDNLLIVNGALEEQEKKEFLNDGIAVMQFGYWFLNEKFTPFFLTTLNG